MVTVTSSRAFPSPFDVNQDVTFFGGGTLPGGGGETAGIRGVGSCPGPGPASSPTLTPGLTHVPGAYEDRDHVRLILLGMLVLHELQELAEGFSLLGGGGGGHSRQSGAVGAQQSYPSTGTPHFVAGMREGHTLPEMPGPHLRFQ